jgi:hypothetical protein
MNKEFIPYEQALELKELGFNEECYAKYNRKEFQHNSLGGGINYNDNSYGNNLISAPLYQQAFRWFREKHKFFTSIHPITISTGGKNSFRWRWAAITMTTVFDEIVDIEDESDLGFLTYEEAELACLKKLIEIVKNKYI